MWESASRSITLLILYQVSCTFVTFHKFIYASRQDSSYSCSCCEFRAHCINFTFKVSILFLSWNVYWFHTLQRSDYLCLHPLIWLKSWNHFNLAYFFYSKKSCSSQNQHSNNALPTVCKIGTFSVQIHIKYKFETASAFASANRFQFTLDNQTRHWAKILPNIISGITYTVANIQINRF